MTMVITPADLTMTTTCDADNMTTGDSTPATFDDLPDEIRRIIMMMRADGQAWDSQFYLKRAPIWATRHATKRDLIHFCQLRGFKRTSWTKGALRQYLVSAHTDDYLQHMRRSEDIWQPATFPNRDYRSARAVRVWWHLAALELRYVELAIQNYYQNYWQSNPKLFGGLGVGALRLLAVQDYWPVSRQSLKTT